jgi:UDP-N-acetylmuramyl pentapeptide phosphotransferase/UDP-N-acetylglucosamine-1-phosphate transferase
MRFGLSLVFGIAVLGAIVALWCLSRSALAKTLVDQTDKRQAMHKSPVPRIGGWGIIGGAGIALLATWLLAPPAGVTANLVTAHLVPVAVCVALLMAVSALDDWRGLSSALRLICHLLVVVLFIRWVQTELHVTLDWWAFALSVVGIAWSANLFNFMDGIDGLAGLAGAIGFLSLAIVAALQPDGLVIALLAAALSGGCCGFLPFNLPSARLFMGDAGSIPLGFCAGAIGWLGVTIGVWAWWLPVLAFSPVFVDATWTLAKRLVRREAVWRAHRQHIYQRLVLVRNWSHVRTAIAYAALAAVAGGSAVVAHLRQPVSEATERWLLMGWVITYVLVVAFAERSLRHQKKNTNQQ